MPLNREQKEVVVAEVAAVAKKAYSAVAAEYRGLSVAELTELRVKAREAGVYVRVVKNSLARRAVEDTDFACMQEGMKGPLILAFSQQDPGSAARVIKEFAKGREKMVVRMVSIGGRVLPASQLDVVASMPTYDQALSMLLALMKAPVEKLARTLNEVPGKFVRTVAAIRDAKEAA